MNIVFLGIDLAKNVFQLCGLNQAGKPVYTKRTGRKELLQTLANIPACLIGIEASTGAFYWQREFEKLGHKVKVISPQYVKPFVRGQKNDGNDAQAIAVALMQPTMQFVPPKSPEQQDIQALHRARQRIVNHRTATVCQIRGLLLDRGIPIGSAVSRVRRAIPLILEDAENGLSSRMRRTIAELYVLFNDLERRIHFFHCPGNGNKSKRRIKQGQYPSQTAHSINIKWRLLQLQNPLKNRIQITDAGI